MKRTLRMLRKEYSCKTLVKMKLIVIILVVAAGLQVNAHGYAQNTVTLSERNSSLLKVFKQIKRQTGYSYLVTSDLLDRASKVNIEVTNVSLRDALDMIFREQPLMYSIIGKTIVVKEREEPKKVTVVEGSPVNGLPIDVRGRVVNEKGEPVEGVTVSVKGSKKFTITNANGEFSLATVDPEAVLVFTSVNMETFEYGVSGKEELVVNLKTKVTALGEVTVSVNTGYQELSKERATGSFAQPDRQIFENRVSTDILSRLEGITSGVGFNKNGSLNRTEIKVRGQSTIFANSQPLIVVDNFPYEGDISNINPNDVEDVVILKDAAAASIWGVRAGNGVIVITTKRAKFNQPLKIQLNTNVTVSNKPDLFYDRNFLPASDFIDVEKTLFSRGYYDADLNNTITRQPVSPVVEILAKVRANQISQAEADAQINALRNLDVRNELSKYFYHRAVNQQYAISLNGGSAKANYFFSAGYDKNQSNLIKNGLERLTLNTLNTFLPINNLEVTAGINYTQSVADIDNTVLRIATGGLSKFYNIYPYAQFRDASGNNLSIVKDFRAPFIQTAEANGFLNWQFYPLNELGKADNQRKSTDIRIITGLKYTILKGFTAEVKYQNEKQAFLSQEYNPLGSYFTNSLINKFASVAANGTVIKNNSNIRPFNIPIGGIFDESATNMYAHSVRGQLSFSNTWNKHSINAIAGFEAREITTDDNSFRIYGYDKDLTTYKVVNYDSTYKNYPGGSSKIPNGMDIKGALNRFRSFYSNAAYTFDNRYIFSASARIDGSNYFGVRTNQKSTPLWSVGAKWNIDKEAFYNLSWLPALKLRATYGFNGNLDNTISAITTFSYSSSPASLTNATYANLVDVPNVELRWEKTAMLNLGIDFELKKKIVSGSLEYFSKKGVDMIGDAPFAPSTGITQLRGNFTNMKGHGFDVQLTVRNINRSLKWVTTFLASYATDKVTRYDIDSKAVNFLSNDGYSATIYPIVGRPVYGIYSYRWGGLDPATGDPRGYVNDTLSKTYTMLVNPTNAADMVYNGPARPVMFGGLSNTFSYKGFSLSVNISYKLKYFIRRSSINYLALFNSWKGNADFLNRWQKPGDEASTNIPSMPASANTSRENFYLYSEALVERGDHIRLQDMSLRYDFDKAVGRHSAYHMQIYFYANNLGIIWRANTKGIDPDYPTGGIVVPKSFSFGVRASF